jgi:AcrR family transcriptional regulator
VASSRERIALCALDLIERDGIVGLRIADVATAADVSIPLIYKYFRDRDGLLAEVLSSTVTKNFMNDVDNIKAFVTAASGPVTAQSIVDMMPMPGDPRRKRNRRLRIMAIAASYDIPALADALAESQILIERATAELIEHIRTQTGCTSPITAATIVLVVQALGLGIAVADAAPSTSFTDIEYKRLLVDIVQRHVIGDASPTPTL